MIVSVLFSLLGIIIATNIVSLNQFLFWTVPVELLCFVPAVLHLFQVTPAWFGIYPANVCMDLVSGRVPSAAGVCGLMAFAALLMVCSGRSLQNMWDRTGGARL